MPGNGDRGVEKDPRGLLAADGPGSLADHELLAALLVTGCAGHGSISLSRDIINEAGGLAGLADISHSELCRIRALSGTAPGARLGSSTEVHKAFWPWMAHEKIEVFSCAMVDATLRLIRKEVISRGTLTASIVHPREAFRPAVRNAASGVIFAHNHPSGDPVPSDEDRRITGRLEEVGRILGIPMLDHVIIGAGSAYYSFADAGDLEPQMAGYRGMVLRQRQSLYLT